MLESLSDKLTAAFRNLAGRGTLTEANIAEALRSVRVALLEADVALPVVKDFIEKVKARAIGQDVLQGINPAQQVVKVVHDELKTLLGEANAPLNLQANPPTIILMAGLQGSGKTTSSGKIAKRLKEIDRKKVLLASLDVYRPAAQQQLTILAEQTGTHALPIVAGEKPEAIAKRALQAARTEGFDVLLLDTAGRTTVDAAMMDEIKAVAAIANPHEILLVLDALTGQDAAATATAFHAALPLTGMVLTRIDGDARGGAALSLRHITGQPIKFLATGEKLDAIEPFHPDRLAGRILGMGDIVSLVETAAATIDQEAAQKAAARLQQGAFDMTDLDSQLAQMQKMGGLGGIMNLLPGMQGMKGALQNSGMNDKAIARQRAVIGSMTRSERRDPDLLNASRKRRIAAGAGVKVEEINRLIKQYLGMRDMMRQMKKGGMKGMLRQLSSKMGGSLPGGRGLNELAGMNPAEMQNLLTKTKGE